MSSPKNPNPEDSPAPKPGRPSRGKRVTLKDIAREAGLSAAAVSMALRGSRDVSLKTQERVKKIAERLGYVPDPALSALASYRHELRPVRDLANIALVTNWPTRDGWFRFPNPRRFMEHATARARELGYNLQHFWAREDGISPRRFDQILQARGIQGILLAPPEDIEIELDWDQYAVISIERPRTVGPFHFIEPDQYQAVVECWEVLLNRGYNRVGLVLEAHFGEKWDHRWEAAHQQMQYTYGSRLNNIPTLTLTGTHHVEQIRSWLRRYRPEVVINRSEAFHEAVRAEGLSIPEDLAYITLNVDADVEGASGIQQPWAEMGSLALDLLHSQLIRNRRGRLDILRGTQIAGTWVDGKTLPVRRATNTPSRGPRPPICAADDVA